MTVELTTTPADEPIVRLRHPWRWVAVAVIVLYAAVLVRFLVTNDALRWDLVRGYLFETSVLRGVVTTLKLTVVAMLVGAGLGTLLAIMRLSENPVLRWTSGIYVWFFRGTPILVQLLGWYFLASVLPEISLGIPFGPSFASWSTNDVVTPFMAAILGLGLNEAAYMAEIVRAGIGGVDPGQAEAAEALGMSPAQSYRRIILPQASRLIIPPTANETITMLKQSSLVVVLGMLDLTGTAQAIYSRNFQQIPLLLVASIWYLALTTILTYVQMRLERRMSRGAATSRRPRRTRKGAQR
ncbi:amino acid ABC transporter permease [Nocardioides panacihumi]|uniref:Amino acid ABC transporter permease n=1 Tax=Nocardioides panacihumi TaxID=400774 RepID=A0ABN2RV62_9ACTN